MGPVSDDVRFDRLLLQEAGDGWQAGMLRLLDAVREEGGVVFLKADGERSISAPRWTALASQGRLSDRHA